MRHAQPHQIPELGRNQPSLQLCTLGSHAPPCRTSEGCIYLHQGPTVAEGKEDRKKPSNLICKKNVHFLGCDLYSLQMKPKKNKTLSRSRELKQGTVFLSWQKPSKKTRKRVKTAKYLILQLFPSFHLFVQAEQPPGWSPPHLVSVQRPRCQHHILAWLDRHAGAEGAHPCQMILLRAAEQTFLHPFRGLGCAPFSPFPHFFFAFFNPIFKKETTHHHTPHRNWTSLMGNLSRGHALNFSGPPHPTRWVRWVVGTRTSCPC